MKAQLLLGLMGIVYSAQICAVIEISKDVKVQVEKDVLERSNPTKI